MDLVNIYKRVTYITFILVLSVITTSAAQNSDRKSVEQSIDYYIVGWRNGDVALLEKTFDMDAGVVLWVDTGGDSEKLNSMPLSQLAAKVKPHADYGVGYHIQNLDIIDSKLAMARVKIPMPSKGSYYIDYLQLQKINGEWRIVLKSFVYFPKE